jgi:hypothetical protein
VIDLDKTLHWILKPYMLTAHARGFDQDRVICALGLTALSKELAVSHDSIERWVKLLEGEGFTLRRRRARATFEFVFLPHQCFSDYAEVPSFAPADLAQATRRPKDTLAGRLHNSEL